MTTTTTTTTEIAAELFANWISEGVPLDVATWDLSNASSDDIALICARLGVTERELVVERQSTWSEIREAFAAIRDARTTR